MLAATTITVMSTQLTGGKVRCCEAVSDGQVCMLLRRDNFRVSSCLTSLTDVVHRLMAAAPSGSDYAGHAPAGVVSRCRCNSTCSSGSCVHGAAVAPS